MEKSIKRCKFQVVHPMITYLMAVLNQPLYLCDLFQGKDKSYIL